MSRESGQRLSMHAPAIGDPLGKMLAKLAMHMHWIWTATGWHTMTHYCAYSRVTVMKLRKRDWRPHIHDFMIAHIET